jgi:uncharacterized coiled-coil protein SlyX
MSAPPFDDSILLQAMLDRLERMESHLRLMDARLTRVHAETGVEPNLPIPANEAPEIPEMLESIILTHIDEMRANLHAGTQALVNENMAAFEKTIGEAVSGRMSMLEKTLIDQSGIITTLSQRAIASDGNLQRLISAVERLCERSDVRPAALTVTDLAEPFDAQLNAAEQRQSRDPDSGFRPRIITAEEEKALRHRVPLTRF